MLNPSEFIFITISETTFDHITLAWIAIALITFLFLLKITPPYGRYSSTTWGPVIDNKLSWVIMEVPSLSVIAWFFMKTSNSENRMVFIAFILWMIHYFNRAFVFPFRLRTKSKKMPVLIMLQGAFFNIVNAGLNGYWLAFMAPKEPVKLINNPHIIIGIAIFITGFAINQYHDSTLIRIRKFNTGYKIPYGGLFRQVSCPNFLGEIIQWTGFAIMCRSLPALSFAIWTFVNLVPRALNHHKWYKEKFNEYPADRKAVFPYIL